MPNYSAKDKWLAGLAASFADGSFVKATLSGFRGRDQSLKNVFIRPVTLRDGLRLQFVYRHATRDVTRNFDERDAIELLNGLVGDECRHANLFTTRLTYSLEFREGKSPRLLEGKPAHNGAPSTAHDRTKKRRIDPASPWLQALKVTAADGKIAKGMEAKFRQIDKFVELLSSLLVDARLSPDSNPGPVIEDMGCGKGYLTFAAYEWLRKSGYAKAQVRGMEVRPELVEAGNRIAKEAGFAGLKFETGTITGVTMGHVDVLIALHACDTATDDAIARGIESNAALILASPCCHKEVRSQLAPAAVLAPWMRHGILLERQAEFATDVLRAGLLEWAGYETRIFEFISTEHTAKNLMIAGLRRRPGRRDESALVRVRELAAFYGVRSQHLASRLGVALRENPLLVHGHD